MIVSIASGKGGTGKTTVAVNLALSLVFEGTTPIHFLDCDVEEPNAHLFLKPKIECSEKVTLPVPVVDESKCNGCGRCAEVCAFHAILAFGSKAVAFPELCHGCGGCVLLCPEKAIAEHPREIGVVESGRAGGIRYIQGRVDIGNPLAPPVVKAVRRAISPALTSPDACGEANAIADDGPAVAASAAADTAGGVVIIDAPPGTSCPVVASIKGSDFCVLVTEPTPFGLNDLALAVDVVRELRIPFGVVINRAGLGNDEVSAYCSREGIPVLLEIPFDRRYAECYAKGGQLIYEFPEMRETFRRLWHKIITCSGIGGSAVVGSVGHNGSASSAGLAGPVGPVGSAGSSEGAVDR